MSDSSNAWRSYYSFTNGGGSNCKCEQTVWVVSTAGKKVFFGKQCPTCGKFFLKSKKSIPEGVDPQPRNELAYNQYKRKKDILLREAIQRNSQSQSKKENNRLNYEKYIKGNQWKLKRQLKLERCYKVDNKPMCEWCGKQEATEIHHLNYDRFGDERLTDLVALCANCHNKEHSNKVWR